VWSIVRQPQGVARRLGNPGRRPCPRVPPRPPSSRGQWGKDHLSPL